LLKGSDTKISFTETGVIPLDELAKIAVDAGATRAKLMDAKDVVVDKRVRLKCSVPRCYAYGSCLTCPPNIMSVKEFQEILACYHNVLVVQVEADQNSLDRSSESLGSGASDLFKQQLARLGPFRLKLHDVIDKVEAEAFKQGYAYTAGFGGGRCILCGDECPGIVDNKCRHPFRARPAMEAMGIDIRKTAEKAGFSVELSSKENIKFTGLILID